MDRRIWNLSRKQPRKFFAAQREGEDCGEPHGKGSLFIPVVTLMAVRVIYEAYGLRMH